MRTARRRVLAGLVVGALVLSGCGRLDPFDTDATPAEIRQIPDDVNAADVAFLRGMILHLRAGQSLTAAALDPDTGAGDDVARIAQHIEEEDSGRIVKMAELLDDWGDGSIASTDPEIERALADLTGEAFDSQWALLMIEHHEQTAALAETAQRDGSSRTVNNLASGLLVDFGFETTMLSSP